MRHGDPRLGPYTGDGQQLRAAAQLASDVEGLRLALMTTIGERYWVRVADDERNATADNKCRWTYTLTPLE